VHQPSFVFELPRGGGKLALAKSIEEIADEKDPLSLPARQAFTNQIFNPLATRLSDIPAKPA